MSVKIPTYVKLTSSKTIDVGLANLQGGIYEVTEDFANPLHTKRDVYGFKGQAICQKGSLIRVVRDSQTETFNGRTHNWDNVSIKDHSGGGREILRVSVYSNGTTSLIRRFEHSTPDMTSRRRACLVETLLPKLKKRETTFTEAVSKVYHFQGNEVLAMLIEQGVLTLDTVLAAAEDVNNLDEKGSDDLPNYYAFRKRHGMN